MFTMISTVNLMKPRKPTKHGTKPESPIFSLVSPGVLMPEPLLAAKKFGSRVGQAKLAEFLEEHRDRVSNGNSEVSAKMTFGERSKFISRIKPTTRPLNLQAAMLEPDFVALLKSWPGLADRELRRITKTDCNEWARALRKVASPTWYNNTLAGLRHVFEVAKDVGVIYRNPAE